MSAWIHAVRRMLAHPPPWVQWTAGVAFATLAGNLFWHGAQPYAVGLIPSPWDKGAHALVFGALAALCRIGLGNRTGNPDGVAAGVTMAVAIADELHQSYLPGRSTELMDLAFDALGVSCALALTAIALRAARRAS